jgi:hypothetical protein
MYCFFKVKNNDEIYQNLIFINILLLLIFYFKFVFQISTFNKEESDTYSSRVDSPHTVSSKGPQFKSRFGPERGLGN